MIALEPGSLIEREHFQVTFYAELHRPRSWHDLCPLMSSVVRRFEKDEFCLVLVIANDPCRVHLQSNMLCLTSACVGWCVLPHEFTCWMKHAMG